MPFRVVIAPDSFKGSLDAVDVALAIAEGWRSVRPGDDLTLLPHASAGAVTGIRIRPGGNGAIQKLRFAGSIPSHDF